MELRATGGNFAFATVTKTCLGNDFSTPSVFDAFPVASGQGFWYLVRSVDPSGSATYDSGSPFQVDYRDDEIAASGNDCP